MLSHINHINFVELKSNKAKKNTYKPGQGKKASSTKPSKANLDSEESFFKSQRLKKALGLFLILFSVFLLLAFVSYLFTWKSYDHLVDSRAINWELLTDSGIRVDNMMGRLGAIFAHLFIKMGFGVSSFLFLLFFFSGGIKLLTNYSLFPVKKLSAYSLFFLLWISLFFGFLVVSDEVVTITGGFFGYHAAQWFNGFIGHAGTAILLLFSIGTFFILAYNPNFRALAAWFSRLFTTGRSPEKESLATADDTETPQNVQKMDDDEKTDDSVSEDQKPGAEEQDEDQSVDDDEEDDFFYVIKPGAKSTGDGHTGNTGEPGDTVLAEGHAKDSIALDPVTEKPTRAETGEEPEWEIEVGKEKLTGNNYQAIDTPFSNDKDDIPDLSHLGEYDPTLDLPHYRIPELSLLDDRGSGTIQINKEELESNKNRIIDTLKNYAIDIDKIKATVGPTVTLYEIVPAPGVRISKIKNLENDIALSLSALGIRIIAPIPGRGTIGIEVPNSNPEIVSMRSVLSSERFRNSSFELPIGLGKTIANETFIADLTKMPHLLMAGATGQGKSVGLNAILTSILYKKHPAYVKFVLIDPKKVELNLFSKIERHFLAKLPDTEEAIVTETREVIRTINSLCLEMDNRYDLLKDAQARNIKEYNAKYVSRRLNPNEGHRFLPYIVLFIDEFADLIMTAGKEIELPIARLAQLARAVGIHLVIATQRPSVNIITGTIKANFPARIAFRVTAKVDSRTILDGSGADQLIGRGDMLLSTGSDLLRLQCAFIDTPEIEKITEFIGAQKAYPDAFHLPEYFEDDAAASESIDPADRDELFEDAARIVVATQQGSTSLIQRKLKLGYNRAGRIIDQLEAAGIVGAFEGSKAREVLIKDEMSLEQILQKDS